MTAPREREGRLCSLFAFAVDARRGRIASNGLAFQQLVRTHVEDLTQCVSETHVKSVNATLGSHEAKRRAPRNLVALDERRELVGVLRRSLGALHELSDSYSHLQHVTDTNTFVTNVKSGTDAWTGTNDSIDTSARMVHIQSPSAESVMATCSKGWGGRCPASHGKRCKCRCGGSNHGTALGGAQQAADRHARWDVVAMTNEDFTIRDIGHTYGRSITNDAEWVVEQIAPDLRGRRLFYYDSMGQLDELLVRDGRFAGFAPGFHSVGLALTA